MEITIMLFVARYLISVKIKYKFFFIFSIAVLFFTTKAMAQNNYQNVTFNVIDSLTRQSLPKVTVAIPSLSIIKETDKSGNVFLGLPQDQYVIFIDCQLYKPKQIFLDLKKDTLIAIVLSPQYKHYLIEEVEVKAEHFNKNTIIQSGMEKISSVTIKSLPTLAGEKDVIKTLNSMPGVSQGSEGSADIFVRGGTTDQNLFLLEHNVIYKPTHLFGFLSSVNPQAVKEIDFYKGDFPVNYGGKLSSVIAVKMKDPVKDSLMAQAELSTISAKMTIEAPIIRNKTGILLSGRTTHYDKFYEMFNNTSLYKNAGFYDAYSKILHRFSRRDNITVNLYSDHDYFIDVNKPVKTKNNSYSEKFIWKNQFANFEYKHSFSDNSTISLISGITKYNMQMLITKESEDTLLSYKEKFNSYIKNKYTRLLYIGNGERFDFLIGSDYMKHSLLPAETIRSFSDTSFSQNSISPSGFHEINAYASAGLSINAVFKVHTGLRYCEVFSKTVKWHSIEPRVNLQYLINDNNSIKISYSKVSQPIHLLTNAGLGMPVDIYIPFSKDFQPGSSNQFSIDQIVNKEIFKQMFYLTIGGYYKQLNSIIAYLPGTSSHNFTSSQIVSKSLEEILTKGKGKSYGLELLIEKPFGKFNGRLAYTISKIEHSFDKLNKGNTFYAKHHRPHNLSIVTNYNVNKKHSFSINFSYISGERVTLPLYIYNRAQFDFGNGNIDLKDVELMPFFNQSEMNAYKMRDFHTLNISYVNKIFKKRWTGEWEFGIYNIYNRRNSFYYTLKQEYNSQTANWINSTPKLKSVSLFPIIPSITFRMNF